jgi:hypothetical protein
MAQNPICGNLKMPINPISGTLENAPNSIQLVEI